ncbi:hypothetical protein BCR43DRAFT_359252 [Syncephalastrum racemosum]|uniref:Uncharacterized protein n=1 Tax=Syncephalastrum racemosum TaxID=13706 RepID=A0A1X2H6V7_SYNRA|nr:hypothetical protein BCR43DRAFT_359252 [Syncephalastrum racemosum]
MLFVLIPLSSFLFFFLLFLNPQYISIPTFFTASLRLDQSRKKTVPQRQWFCHLDLQRPRRLEPPVNALSAVHAQKKKATTVYSVR